jgi:hypothetical protein
MQKYELWSVPVFEATWPQHQEHQSALRDVCDRFHDKQNLSGVSENIKHGLYESGFDFAMEPDPAVQAWKQWVSETVYNVVVSTNIKYWPKDCRVAIEMHESWCHITGLGGYHDRHLHPNSSWSVIYYLDPADTDIKTSSGINRFYNPTSVAYSDGGTLWCSESSSIDIAPEPGSMVIFPSWIQHAAMPYHGDRPRYIISANCKVLLLT